MQPFSPKTKVLPPFSVTLAFNLFAAKADDTLSTTVSRLASSNLRFALCSCPLSQCAEAYSFFFLDADANRDGKVDSMDFNALAAHFGATGTLFSEGDFNYDGFTNTLDFNALVQRYGTDLHVSAPLPSASATTAQIDATASSNSDASAPADASTAAPVDGVR